MPQPRSTLCVVNPFSSRYEMAKPFLTEMLEAVDTSIMYTSRSHEATREAIGKRVLEGAIVVGVGGDATQTDVIAGMLQADKPNTVYAGVPAGGENDTPRAVHGAHAIDEIATAISYAQNHDALPVQTIYPFQINMDGSNDIGLVSGAVGAIARGMDWFEREKKTDLNNQGRSRAKKLWMVVDYYNKEGREYRLSGVCRNDKIVPYGVGSTLIMNGSRVGGMLYNLKAHEAIREEWFVVNEIDASSQPQAVLLGIRALTGFMRGEVRTEEKIFSRADKPVPVQVDGEYLGEAQQVTFTKDPTMHINALDVTEITRVL